MTTIAERTTKEAAEEKKEPRGQLIGRPYVDGRSLARIAAQREQIKALPFGVSFPELSTFEGFSDWLASPITIGLLARCERKREDFRDDLEKMKPCASCRKESDLVDKEFRGWTAGAAEILDAVARTILSGQEPRCDHEPAEPAPPV